MVCGKTEKKKMRRCVEDIKDHGKSEDSAYAICTESIKKAYNEWRDSRESVKKIKNNDLEEYNMQFDDTDVIIVARHPGILKWLESKGITGEVIDHITDTLQIKDKTVVGILPLNLAAETKMVYSIDMPGLPKEMRGVELTPDEMDKYGATITKYKVTKL